MKITRAVVASKNPDKITEVEEILETFGVVGEIVRGLSWPDVEETEPTLEGNALLKARAVVTAVGIAAIADDTGLEIAALGGAPGVLTARYAGPNASYADNVAKLLSELDGVSDRSARFRTAVAFVTPDGTEIVAEGSVEGVISHEVRGDRGFGYDPVFEVDGRTFSEMSLHEKHGVSHRSRAIRNLARKLGEA